MEEEKVGEAWTEGTSLGRSRKRRDGRRTRRRTRKRKMRREMRRMTNAKGGAEMEYQCERKEEWLLARKEEKQT